MFIYLFGVLRRFQHCTGHITTGSWKGRGNQYIQFVRVLYCKLPTNGKQLPAFPLEAMTGMESRPQRWEVRVLPLCHRGPCKWMSDGDPRTRRFTKCGLPWGDTPCSVKSGKNNEDPLTTIHPILAASLQYAYFSTAGVCWWEVF